MDSMDTRIDPEGAAKTDPCFVKKTRGDISVGLSCKHTRVSFFFLILVGGNIKLQVYVHLRLSAARI